MEIKKYIITLKHDSGKIKIATTATTAKKAIETVCKFENAPINAVCNVEEIKKIIV